MLSGSACFQSQCVDRFADQMGQSFVDKAMLCDGPQAVEFFRSDLDPEMAVTGARGATVAGVQMAFVDNLQLDRLQRRQECMADSFLDFSRLPCVRRHDCLGSIFEDGCAVGYACIARPRCNARQMRCCQDLEFAVRCADSVINETSIKILRFHPGQIGERQGEGAGGSTVRLEWLSASRYAQSAPRARRGWPLLHVLHRSRAAI